MCCIFCRMRRPSSIIQPGPVLALRTACISRTQGIVCSPYVSVSLPATSRGAQGRHHLDDSAGQRSTRGRDVLRGARLERCATWLESEAVEGGGVAAGDAGFVGWGKGELADVGDGVGQDAQLPARRVVAAERDALDAEVVDGAGDLR